MGKRRVDKMGKRRVDKMGKRIVGKIAGSTSKRHFIRPIIQNEPQPSLQVPKRQFMRPGSQSVQQGQVLLPAQPAPEPQTIMHEPFPAPQRHFMPLTTQDVQQSLPFLKGQKRLKRPMTRRRRLFVVCSIVAIIVEVYISQPKSGGGAWMADTMRAVLGPTTTAQIESWYLGLSDTTHQVQYNLSGQHVDAPWSVAAIAPTPVPPPTWSTLSAMPLGHISPMVSPGLSGEGVWFPQGSAPSPYNYLPLAAKTFIRPDSSHPYAIVTLLQFDTRFINLHMVAGTIEPGGPRGFYGPGVIPANDQKGNVLLAAFNGGFKYSGGQYGFKTKGAVFFTPQNGSATNGFLKNCQMIMGAWGVDPRLNTWKPDLVAWRQNASLLINKGVINPLTQDGAAWGGTILNSAYTWRSGLGLTSHGTLIYAAGNSLNALTLGLALRAAGAVTAMQTDINPFWVPAFLYNRDTHSNLNITKLHPAMQGTGTEYLYGTQRDFFYLTRFSPPPPPPQPSHSREAPPQ